MKKRNRTDEFILDDYTEDKPYSKDNKLNRKINDEVNDDRTWFIRNKK